jgi:phenylalanyl-tRNA synthetase beta chain
MAGFEDVVAEATGPDLGGVVVGQVVTRDPHPNADRLSLCRVDTGTEELPVVCGAPNVAAGQKIAFAPVGTRLPDGTKLKKARIRGQVSQGMICSARELALGDEHDGILVLDPEAPVGAPLTQVIGAADRVMDLTLTPNRGDAASLLGIAREVRALFGGDLRLPLCEPAEEGLPAADAIAVAIDAVEDCPHYVARVVRGVRVAPSPDWVCRRLEASGIRPIHNVVDVTNLVLMELGQPLHAFDLSRIGGAQIRVRRAAAGEKLATLDGETRELSSEDLVIADGAVPVALAGVMGGADSEVGERTADVLIESALFHPTRVRLGARRHGLRTEASYRFERGVDREGVRRAADRAARLMAELCGGHVAPGTVEARGEPLPVTEEIELPVGRVGRVLGIDLSRGEVADVLERLGIDCDPRGEDALLARIPSHRNDLHRREDLIEEVARIHGYDRIPATYPLAELLPVSMPEDWRRSEAARDALVAVGLTECMSFPFLRPGDLDLLRLDADDPRRSLTLLQNPVSEAEPALRTTLVPAVLRTVRHNRSRQVDRIRLFELGRAFLPGGEEGRPRERLEVCAAFTPRVEPRLWQRENPPPIFYTARGAAKSLMVQMGYDARLRRDPEAGPARPYLHPGAAVAIEVAGRVVGAAGEIHPEVAHAFGIDVPCALIELDLSALEGLPVREGRYRDVSRQPPVRRDLAVLVDRAQAAEEVRAAIHRAGGANLVSVEIFDRYEGKGVPEGRVSLAFRLVFQRPDRTLTDAEVTSATDRVVEMLADRFGGTLR